MATADVNPRQGTRRRYDNSAREAKAAERRQAVLTAARRQFLRDGFGRTTLAAVASEAEVSVESVYKWFGSKAGLLRAVYEQSLLGAGPTPAEERSDTGSRTATDGAAIIRNWSVLAAEVGALADPIHRLIAYAAPSHPDVAALHAEIEAERARRMEHNAAYLVDGGYLRDDVSPAHARDILMLYTTFYERLVTEAGWSTKEFSTFIERGLAAHLLRQPGAVPGPAA